MVIIREVGPNSVRSDAEEVEAESWRKKRD